MLEQISQQQLSQKLEQFNLKDNLGLETLRYEKFDTLRNNNKHDWIQTDQYFISDVHKISKVRQSVFANLVQFSKQQLTNQQCDQLDYQARIHCLANSLNKNSSQYLNQIDDFLKCKCGCKRAIGQKLSIFADNQQISIVGPGSMLLLLFLKFITGCLVMVVLIYGIFCLFANLNASGKTYSACQDKYCQYKVNSSMQKRNYADIHKLIQNWLGLIFCFIWIILIRVLKNLGLQLNIELDKGYKTAADFAIKIQNLPYGQYMQFQLIEYLERLYKKNLKFQLQQSNNQTKFDIDENNIDCGMRSIQIVYNMEFSRNMINQIFQLSVQVDKLITYDSKNQKRNIVKNPQVYKVLKNKLQRTFQLLQDLRKKFLNDLQFRKQLSTTCCIIDFFQPTKASEMLKVYGSHKIGIIKQIQQRIKQKIRKFFNQNQQSILFKGNVLSIERAPQPSDVLWINCQKKYSIFRIILIHTITNLIILVSFGIILILNFFQQKVRAQESDKINTILPIINLISSIVLMIINKILWLSLFYLLTLQYNHTVTQKVVSQMNKGVFHMSINVIVLPILVSFYIQKEFYGQKGLVGMVFDYQISLLTIGLIIRFMNPINMIKRILLYARISRNFLIRFLTSKRGKLQKESLQVNKFYEQDQLDIADYYVIVMGAIYHAVFFASLTPSILFFVTAMVFFFYWIIRNKIIKQSKLSEMIDYLVFDTALSQANLVPMMYGIGSIVTSYLASSIDKQKSFSYVFGIIQILLSFVSFMNPRGFLNKIITYFRGIFTQHQKQQQIDQKVKLQSYFNDSNSLMLLGFQEVLNGKSQKKVANQLENFCQSFFPASQQIQKKVKNIARGVKNIGMQRVQKNNNQVIKIIKSLESVQQLISNHKRNIKR